MTFDRSTFRISESGKLPQLALNIGIVAMVATFVGYFVDSKQFFHSYLTAFVFWLTIVLGGLFFTMLHHLTGARWSVVLRRISETTASVVPLMILLFVPLLFGIHDLYHWSHGDAVAHDELLKHKSAFLNQGFFIVRALIYFAVWFALSRILYRRSLKQDTAPSEGLSASFVKVSAPGMILFALTLTFASFDWLMSLDPHWYSTIFGVYLFAGTVLAILSFVILVSLHLRKEGILHDTITVEHYHDLGKLLFGFTVFWAYIAFSQFFLIWYANIPEETIWYLHRWEGSWKYWSLLLLFGHFILPFLILLGRAAKRNYSVLAIMALWMLFIHWADIYWLVMPNLHKHGVHLSWMDVTAVLGVGGLVLWWFSKRLFSQPLVPVADPHLESSMKFQNA